jgi:phosphate transport system protein
MVRHFDSEIQKVKSYLLKMGAEAMRAISIATSGLACRDGKQLNEVIVIENDVNAMNKAVDEYCLKLLALQSPVARDLRLVIAMIKTNADIERIADRATNLALIGRNYLGEVVAALDPNLINLATAAIAMVHDALQSFMHLDLALAQSVLVNDKDVDHARDQISLRAVDYLKHFPSQASSGVNLILLARNLERIADHATNIAENTIFIATGEDVRHTVSRTLYSER